jgi:hypothetical protein
MGPADGDPSWRHRQRHEIGVYQIFAEYPPACTSMSCFWILAMICSSSP